HNTQVNELLCICYGILPDHTTRKILLAYKTLLYNAHNRGFSKKMIVRSNNQYSILSENINVTGSITEVYFEIYKENTVLR
ncbi:MAG: hypothetical protein JXB24_03955, partial [Bacteroidales bacterium]|nr:hypothetical protein [Bacteroidales bacterium]